DHIRHERLQKFKNCYDKKLMIERRIKMKLKSIYIIFLFVSFDIYAQQSNDTIHLNLQQVVEMAKQKSIASKQAVTVKETKYWEWRTYKSNYQPQLSLNGILPGYSKSFIEVVQPNGTVEFQPVHNDNASLNMSFSQSIAATGGTIFGTTELQ